MEKRYYIAYGSNLNVRQMYHRCPGARIVGIAMVKDYELLYKGSKTGAYLTIEPKEGCQVPVAVWSVTPEDEKNLDIYEGFPTFYYKKNFKLKVAMANGKAKNLDVFAYIMHEERKLGKPFWQYIEVCKDGYTAFGFNHRYLDEAYVKSVKGALK